MESVRGERGIRVVEIRCQVGRERGGGEELGWRGEKRKKEESQVIRGRDRRGEEGRGGESC